MQASHTGEPAEEDGIEQQSLLPPRRRHREFASSNQSSSNLWENEQGEPSISAAAMVESENPQSYPLPQAQTSVSSSNNSTFQSNGAPQLNPVYHPPPDLSSITGQTSVYPQPIGIPIPDPNSMQSSGNSFFQQLPATGASFTPFSQPYFPQPMGNTPDQQRFLMAWMDVYKFNMGLMQPSPGPPAPNQSQPQASTSTQPPPPQRSESPRCSRKRSHSVSSNDPDLPLPPTSTSKGKGKAILRTPSDPRHIFKSEAGSPLSFFVQVDMTNRTTIVSKIRKHGGIIGTEQENADYSVLQSTSKVFKAMLKTSSAVKKPAVSASFIHECVEHGVLFDYTPFLLQPLQEKEKEKMRQTAGDKQKSVTQAPAPAHFKPSSRARSASSRSQSSSSDEPLPLKQVAVKSQHANRPKSALTALKHSSSPSLPPQSPSVPPKSPSFPPQPAQLKFRKTSDPQTVKKEKEKEKEVEKKVHARRKEEKGKVKEKEKEKEREKPAKSKAPNNHLNAGERSPSPPPAHTRVPWGDESFRYPPVEKDYALRYAKVLFGRDPEMNMTTVAQKIHDKLPHHTYNSWLTTLTGQGMRTEIETIRRRAGIVYRKNLYAAQTGQSQGAGTSRSSSKDVEESARSQKRRKTDESPSIERPDPEAQARSDVETIANFLLSRQGQVSEDEQDEATFWGLLTNKARCKTATTWKVFYHKHAQAILAKCDEISQSASGGSGSRG